MEKLLTTQEATDLFSFKPNSLIVWRMQGKGPQYFKVGNKIRYRESDIVNWLEQNRIATQDQSIPISALSS